MTSRYNEIIVSPAWQSNCPNLGDIMSKAKEECMFTDIQFVIGKEESKRTFNAHKSILASGSPVFEKMFYGELQEKQNPIAIEDDSEAFDMLLNYLYGKGNKIQLNFTRAWKYYSIGDKYMVNGIIEDAHQFIKLTFMKEKDFWDLNENGILLQPIFQEKINDFIQRNTHKILKSENFTSVPENLVRQILLMDKLSVFEFELLHSTVKWVNYNFDNEEWEEVMMQLMQHVRFSNLNVEEFCLFTDNFPDAIDAQSCVDIIKHLIDKSNYKLPYWCSTNNNTRNSFTRPWGSPFGTPHC